ncbi:hypothetical protein D3C84_632030 [compost metagenome]
MLGKEGRRGGNDQTDDEARRQLTCATLDTGKHDVAHGMYSSETMTMNVWLSMTSTG